MSHVADSPKKSPFRPHFRAFYPHPAHGSSLRVSRGSCGMPSLRRCPSANWPRISVGNWRPHQRSGRSHPLSGTRETWLASFDSLSTVLPPLATITRCRPPRLGLISCSIPPWFVLSCNLPMTNARAIWLCFSAFLSPPAPCLRLHGALTTGHYSHAPRATRLHPPVPAGSGRAQTLPRWLLPDTDSRFGKDRTGPDRDERSLSFSMAPNRAILRKNQSVFPRSPPLDRRPFSRGRRRSTPVAPSLPAGWP